MEAHRPIKALVFDLDNTLINVPMLYLEDIDRQVRDHFGSDIPDKESEEYIQIYEEKDFESRVDNVELFPDVNIERLSEKFKIGLVTSTNPATAEKEMKALGIYSVFDTIRYSHPEKGFKKKPNPKALEEACNDLDVSAEKVVYFGDKDVDIVAARKAGCIPVWIDRGKKFHTMEEKVKPENTISDMSEIPELVKKLRR